MSHPAIILEQCTVFRGTHRVLHNLSLQVGQRECIAIVGTSGSGKTTLLQTIAGILPATGTLQSSGKVSMIFQDHAIFPWMTVEQNIAFGMPRQKKDPAVIDTYIKHIGLEEKADVYPAYLSGGQRQRVAIAQALAHESDILLMDEPFGALDAFTREQMQRWMLDQWGFLQTVILVTHSIEEAILLSDRILVLHDGGIAKEFRNPFERPWTPDIRFSSTFTQLRQDITRELY